MSEESDKMDAAAVAAIEDLKTKVPAASVKDVADWWKRHYLAAGHKRLARALLDTQKAGNAET